MLPDFVKDSYKQYKDDTDRFATWLVNTAKKCGYEPELPAAGPAGKANAGRKSSSRFPLYLNISLMQHLFSYEVYILMFTRVASRQIYQLSRDDQRVQQVGRCRRKIFHQGSLFYFSSCQESYNAQKGSDWLVSRQSQH